MSTISGLKPSVGIVLPVRLASSTERPLHLSPTSHQADPVALRTLLHAECLAAFVRCRCVSHRGVFVPFDSPDINLGLLMADVAAGKVQLPDFQREWKWEDPRIASLLATVSLGYPIGVVMMLETGGPDVHLAPKLISGVPQAGTAAPEHLLLDEQQRLTSLYQARKA